MKNRHDTPVTTTQFGCNSLMNSQMRQGMSRRGACFVSIFVYFCLLLPPTDSRPSLSYAWETAIRHIEQGAKRESTLNLLHNNEVRMHATERWA